MRVRLKYTKEANCRFLSHLDLVRTFIRSLRRARIPMAYTQGFNPQPRLAFAAPLSVGIASIGEYLDLSLEVRETIAVITASLNEVLPAGIQIIEGQEISEKQRSLMSVVNVGLYVIEIFSTEQGTIKERVSFILEAPQLTGIKRTKKGLVERDIKPYIYSLRIKEETEGKTQNQLILLEMLLKIGSQGSVHPTEILAAMEIKGESCILRQELFIKQEEKLWTPFEVIREEGKMRAKGNNC